MSVPYYKSKAHKHVSLAVKRGKLVRGPCAVCGKTTNGKEPMAAHHRDYSKTLDVTWLCAKCHAVAHRPGNPLCPLDQV